MQDNLTQEGGDIIVETLKKKYFETSSKENYPHTPKITKELDNLEQAIRELQNKRISLSA